VAEKTVSRTPRYLPVPRARTMGGIKLHAA
jgi:hypothetical protein